MSEPALSGADFKKQLQQGIPKMGLFVNSHSPTVAEQLSHSGYDWLLVDTQHGPMNYEKLSVEPGDHLVDLCCGRGGIGLWFASVSRARLTGVDYSSRAIAQASQRATLFVPQPQATFIVSDAAATPLEPKDGRCRLVRRRSATRR